MRISTISFFLAFAVLPAHFAFAATGVSAKKLAMEQDKIRPPQVLETGDLTLGLRGQRGSAFDNASVMGLNYEYMVRPNVGFNLQLHYAAYNWDFQAGGVSGKFKYEIVTPVVGTNFHFDAFQVKNLDTYLTLGVAHSFVNAKWESNVDIPGFTNPKPKGVARSDSTFFIGYANMRYFVDRNWAFNVAVGTGLGNFGLGMDYLF